MFSLVYNGERILVHKIPLVKHDISWVVIIVIVFIETLCKVTMNSWKQQFGQEYVKTLEIFVLLINFCWKVKRVYKQWPSHNYEHPCSIEHFTSRLNIWADNTATKQWVNVTWRKVVGRKWSEGKKYSLMQ